MDDRIDAVRQSVIAFQPVDERAVVSKSRFLDFFSRSTSPFSREADHEHITGSAVVLSTAGTLLHFHKLAKIWCGPGGHVDGLEFPWEAAQREAVEETGIKAWGPAAEPILVHLDVHDTPNDHVHYDLRYLLVSEPDEPAPPPGESPDVEWFADQKAQEVTDFSYRSALIAAHGLRASLGHPLASRPAK